MAQLNQLYGQISSEIEVELITPSTPIILINMNIAIPSATTSFFKWIKTEDISTKKEIKVNNLLDLKHITVKSGETLYVKSSDAGWIEINYSYANINYIAIIN